MQSPPRVHPSHLICDDYPCASLAWQVILIRRTCPVADGGRGANSLFRNILPLSSFDSRILREFPRNLLIPLDQGGGGYTPREWTAHPVSLPLQSPCRAWDKSL
jgi:hypothetical protein